MNKRANLQVLIPALSRQAVFQDDLIKMHAGQSLVERALTRARSLELTERDIIVLTDSEEICLIAERNGASPIYNDRQSTDLFGILKRLLSGSVDSSYDIVDVLVLSPYVPLLTSEELVAAYQSFILSDADVLRPVRHECHRLFSDQNCTLQELMAGAQDHSLVLDSQAFLLFKYHLLADDCMRPAVVAPWTLRTQTVEIETLQDWWVSEKLLQRRRIVFRVIGDNEVGMGHIYRALAIAHELTDHEILFVCDSKSFAVVNKLAGYDYWLDVVPEGKMVSSITRLQPDLVINDILDTTVEYILGLKEKRFAVVNFEDLGSGAANTDLTINELYDEPIIEGDQILWGHEYFFVREEFDAARPHQLGDKVDSILVTFGGVDQNGLTLEVYRAVRKLCREFDIHMNIVTGPGYRDYQVLADEVAKYGGASVTHSTGVMSKIMEQSGVAITSNGRTVYELAHMNIPSIVIPQNARECTHAFASEETGFIPMPPYQKGASESQICHNLRQLLTDASFRLKLMKNIEPYSFRDNKKTVINKILELLKDV